MSERGYPINAYPPHCAPHKKWKDLTPEESAARTTWMRERDEAAAVEAKRCRRDHPFVAGMSVYLQDGEWCYVATVHRLDWHRNLRLKHERRYAWRAFQTGAGEWRARSSGAGTVLHPSTNRTAIEDAVRRHRAADVSRRKRGYLNRIVGALDASHGPDDFTIEQLATSAAAMAPDGDMTTCGDYMGFSPQNMR